MMFMSVHDIEYTRDFVASTGDRPNLTAALDALLALAHWTDDNSDGWAYWLKPRRAATRLLDLAHDIEREQWGGVKRHPDLTSEQVTALRRPIKAMLTRNGFDHSEVF